MNKKLNWIVFVVIVAIVSGSIYWLHHEGLQEKNVYSEFKGTDSKVIPEEAGHITKVDITDWKVFTISELGIELKYPAYFGDAILTKTNRKSCPQMKTYKSGELLPSNDFLIAFTNAPQVGTGGSYMEAEVRIARTENDTDYCGLDISTLGGKMDSDQDYLRLNSGRSGIKEEYASNLHSGLGTDVSQFYSLFFAKRNQMILIQPNIIFYPYAGSNEIKEIESIGNIIDYVKNSKNAESVRRYFRDFEALMTTVRSTD